MFYNEKYSKSATAAEGGGGAIKFSAELMVNRATWQIVECTRFFALEKTESVSHRADLFVFSGVLGGDVGGAAT